MWMYTYGRCLYSIMRFVTDMRGSLPRCSPLTVLLRHPPRPALGMPNWFARPNPMFSVANNQFLNYLVGHGRAPATHETGGLRLILGEADPLSQSLPTPAPHSSPSPCHVPLSLSLSVPHLTSPLQFCLPPRPPAERSVVGWRVGAMCGALWCFAEKCRMHVCANKHAHPTTASIDPSCGEIHDISG